MFVCVYMSFLWDEAGQLQETPVDMCMRPLEPGYGAGIGSADAALRSNAAAVNANLDKEFMSL